MPTLSQLSKFSKRKKKIYKLDPILKGCPQRKGTCLKVIDMSPKKPNSAKRKVARVDRKSTRLNSSH